MNNESKLIKSAYENYKTVRLSSWLLGLATAILIAAILAIDLVAPALCLLTFPLVILPIVFSGILQHIYLRQQGQLTIRGSLVSFGLYYTPIFRGTFRYLFSLLKSVIVFIIFEMTISFILSTIYQLNSPEFVDMINNLYDTIYSETLSLEKVNEILMANDALLFKYLAIVIIPSYFCAVLFLIYNVSRNSITSYFLADNRKGTPQLARYVYMDVLRNKRFSLFKDYWSLNWPLYVVLILGFSGGAVLGYFWKQDLIYMIVCGNVLGAALTMFVFPFYFANQEALYEKYKVYFDTGLKNVTNYMLQNIQRNIDLSNEEKERLEQTFLDDNKDAESKKKDSEEP